MKIAAPGATMAVDWEQRADDTMRRTDPRSGARHGVDWIPAAYEAT